jgi:hypothetical protein
MSILVNSGEEAWQVDKYLAYLATIKERLPRATYRFAAAEWHYDYNHPTCPHDAWVQEIRTREIARGKRHEIRKTQIEITLLGAYHDRLLKLTYKDVASHSINSLQSQRGFWDWLIDEVSLSDSGNVVHEIEFDHQAVLKIECADILFQEQLTSKPYEATWI